jgi:hypothetical protein
MAAPRRDHEQRLADRVPTLGRAVDQEVSDLVGARRATGLARAENLDAGLRYRPDETPLMRRFPGAFAAFERDELTAAQFLRPKIK